MSSSDLSLIYTTCASELEADVLARGILKSKLAGCVNIFPQVTSLYLYEGNLEQDSEISLLIKTLPSKVDELKKWLEHNHSYDVPAIIELEAKGSDAFVSSLRSSLESLLGP